MLRRTIETGPTGSLEPAVLSEATDWMDRKSALRGRLFDIVDEYPRGDRPR